MEHGFYEAQWPRDGIFVSCFVHEVMNFRYHWHQDEIEISLLLNGEQFFCRGRESYRLQAGDVILVDPNVGHASYGQAQDTIALVLHISSRALRLLAPKNKLLSFPSCCSMESTRSEARFVNIRGLASQLILALADGGAYAQFTAKACTEMLLSILCNQFEPIVTSGVPDVDEDTQLVMRSIMSYVEENYSNKITLEDIADISQYNRTYISTLFHKAVGISFYDYVMRVRLQNAMKDLVMTDKNLTDIAFSNGFADLKSFNSRFREMLQCLPSEYRKNVVLAPEISEDYHKRKFIPLTDPFVREKINTFAQITNAPH